MVLGAGSKKLDPSCLCHESVLPRQKTLISSGPPVQPLRRDPPSSHRRLITSSSPFSACTVGDSKPLNHGSVVGTCHVQQTMEQLIRGSQGFSDITMAEEDIATIQLAGLYPLHKYYTAYHITIYAITVVLMLSAVYGSYADGELNVAFETAHLSLIALNIFTAVLTHYFHRDIVEKLLRAIDASFFSYGDTMDGNTRKIILELESEKRERKRIYGKVFKMQVLSAVIGIMSKNNVLYLINGRGVKDVDGENWLIYQGPFTIFIPFSNYWVPYIIGLMISYHAPLMIGLTTSSCATTFIRFSEEFLQQLRIVKLGLRNVIARANHLYTIRYGQSYSLESMKSDKDFDKCLTTCLTKSVEHHTTIIKLFEDFKRLMFVPLFTVIFDGSALICMSTVLLLTSDSTAMKFLMPAFIATELYYTYIYCLYGDLLTEQFTEIGEQLYFDEWLEHSKIMKPYMIIIKAYTFYPKKLSAGGFTTPNLQNFGNVMRTAYSLLNFLLTQR